MIVGFPAVEVTPARSCTVPFAEGNIVPSTVATKLVLVAGTELPGITSSPEEVIYPSYMALIASPEEGILTVAPKVVNVGVVNVRLIFRDPVLLWNNTRNLNE